MTRPVELDRGPSSLTSSSPPFRATFSLRSRSVGRKQGTETGTRGTEMKKVVSVRPTRAMASYQAVPAVWIASR
jgi:hypothetical protein